MLGLRYDEWFLINVTHMAPCVVVIPRPIILSDRLYGLVEPMQLTDWIDSGVDKSC